MNKILIYAAGMMIFVSGCASVPGDRAETDLLLSQSYIDRARDHENRVDLQAAICYLKIALILDPDNPVLKNKMIELKSYTNEKAETHFKKGVKLYNKKLYTKAQNAFTTSLRYNPDHKDSLDYLKTKIRQKIKTVKVKQGDTYRSLAWQIYKDPEMHFLIPFFNDLDPKGTPVPGTPIVVPVLERKFLKVSGDAERELKEAQSFLKTGRYKKAIILAEKRLVYDPKSTSAKNLINNAYFQMGNKLFLEKNYIDAITAFQKVDSAYPGVKDAIDNVNHRMKEDARIAAKQVNTSYLKMGNALLVQGKYLEALDVFEKVDPDYNGGRKAIDNAKARIKEAAEQYYKDGVKHFVEENLKGAIDAWEKTLHLVPEHEKALENIDKAKHLLEKLEKVDSNG